MVPLVILAFVLMRHGTVHSPCRDTEQTPPQPILGGIFAGCLIFPLLFFSGVALLVIVFACTCKMHKLHNI